MTMIIITITIDEEFWVSLIWEAWETQEAYETQETREAHEGGPTTTNKQQANILICILIMMWRPRATHPYDMI